MTVLVTLAIILISAFSLSDYETTYSRYTKKTSSPKANRDMLPVTAIMLALAIIAFFLPFVYTIVVGRIFAKPRATVNYNGGTLYPNNVAINPNATFYPQNLQQSSYYPPPNTNSNINPTIQNSTLY